MAKKKRPTTLVQLRLPTEVMAFYEGVAAYSGVSLEDVIKVVLVIDMLKGRSQGK